MDRERETSRYLEGGTSDGALPARMVDYTDFERPLAA